MFPDGSRIEEKSANEAKMPNNSDSSQQFIPPYNHANFNQPRSQPPNPTNQNVNIYNRSSSLRRVEQRTSPEDGRSSQPRTNSQSPSPYGRASLDLPRNPVLDRLTGKSNNAAVRNESYYRVSSKFTRHYCNIFICRILVSRDLIMCAFSNRQPTKLIITH